MEFVINAPKCKKASAVQKVNEMITDIKALPTSRK